MSAAVTGLRIGEVLALRWKRVDWNKFRIYVVSNFVRGKFGEPKSAASNMDKRMEARAKMIEAMDLNEETAQQLIH